MARDAVDVAALHQRWLERPLEVIGQIGAQKMG